MSEDEKLKQTRFLFIGLFIFILLNIVIEPLLQNSLPAKMISDVIFLVVLAISVFIINKRFIGMILFMLTILSTISTYLLFSKAILVISCVVSSWFFAMVIYQIVTFVYSRRTITVDAIIGGFCAYMLIGLLFALLYINIETMNSGSFNFGFHTTSNDIGKDSSLLFFYSFTSLLTMGLGDIAPISPIARVLTILEGLVGQFYIVFFISSLVGMFISGRQAEKEQRIDEE